MKEKNVLHFFVFDSAKIGAFFALLGHFRAIFGVGVGIGAHHSRAFGVAPDLDLQC